MDPSPEQRRQFGETLKTLRTERGLTIRALASLVGTDLARVVPHQSISQWEKGHNAPDDRTTVVALERCLGAPGRLLPLLGYGGEMSLRAELDALHIRLNKIEEIVRTYLEGRPTRAR